MSARRARHAIAPLLQRHLPYVYGALGVVLGLYFLIAPTQSLRSLLTTLVLGAMAALGIHQLHRQTATEFPAAGANDQLGRARDRMFEAGRSIGESAKRIRVPESAREFLIGRRISGEPTGDGPSDEPTPQPPVDAPTEELPVQAGTITQASDQETRITHLERLGTLYERGLISEEEFAAEKTRVLGAEPPSSNSE